MSRPTHALQGVLHLLPAAVQIIDLGGANECGELGVVVIFWIS